MATSLSYREKSLYASLATELLVYGPLLLPAQQISVSKVAGMLVIADINKTAAQIGPTVDPSDARYTQ